MRQKLYLLFKRIKNTVGFFYLKNKPVSKVPVINNQEEDEFYALEGYQLKNLMDKNINFHFFALDFVAQDFGLSQVLKKAKHQAKEDILVDLQKLEVHKNQPIVLVCKTGESSRLFSKELREQGFLNCYFLKKGFESVKSTFLV